MADMAWLRERLELAKEMRACPSHPKEGECDYTPPLELLGIYIAYSTIARMVHKGELDPAAACYLNAALGFNTFAVIHHCTHESVSQHNPEHAALENTAFRLGCALHYLFDDGYREAHRFHHIRTGAPNDPDLWVSDSSLPAVGNALFELTAIRHFVTLGVPLTPRLVELLRRSPTSITRWALNSWLAKRFLVNWDNVTLKMAVFEAQHLMEKRQEYADLRRTLQATWTGANALSACLLALFVARYPHRHAPEPSEVESYYDTSFRGQGEADLWMNGEGAHDLHHAKPDVSHSLLPRISLELGQRRPDLTAKVRGNGDIEGLEYAVGSHQERIAKAKHLDQSSPPSTQFAWRTEAVRAGKSTMASDLPAGVEKIAAAVLDSALHVCTTADRVLLRKLTDDMGYPDTKEEDPDHPLPASRWASSVFADETVLCLDAARGRIHREVAAVARNVGEHVQARGGSIAGDEDLKSRYFDFFVALCDTLVTAEDQQAFARAFAEHLLPEGLQNEGREMRREMLQRLTRHLESDVPSNFTADRSCYGGSEAKTRQRMTEIFFGPVAARSRL